MDANDLLGIASSSRYLRAVDVGEGATFTIDRITVESMRQDSGQDRDKGVVWFQGEERGLVLNVTLTVILRELFGVDLGNWQGKRITLHNDKSVRRGGKLVGGIRIKSSPDIAEDVAVVAGGNAFSKGTRYVIKAEASAPSRAGRGSQNPLVQALKDHGLTVDNFDQWAASAGRPPAAKMAPNQRRNAGEWIHDGGHRAIRQAMATPAALDDDDPMVV